MNEYLTVSEYAKLEGISVQAVYKRLNGSLKPFLIIKDGRKLIKSECLTSTHSTTFKPEFKTDSTLDSTIVDVLRAQLEAKDRQIEQLTNALDNVTASLKAAQALHAGTIKELTNESETNSNPRGSVQNDHTTSGVLRRLFGRNRRSADQ